LGKRYLLEREKSREKSNSVKSLNAIAPPASPLLGRVCYYLLSSHYRERERSFKKKKLEMPTI